MRETASSDGVVVLASADPVIRERIRETLTSRQWTVHEATGGAEAMVLLEQKAPELVLIDSWLPDLEATSFVSDLRQLFPRVDVIHLDAPPDPAAHRSLRREEVLQILRGVTQPAATDGAAWASALPVIPRKLRSTGITLQAGGNGLVAGGEVLFESARFAGEKLSGTGNTQYVLPGIVGSSQAMQELARLVRLVAPHSARVLIEGETGTGKELIARAVHNLSTRSQKPFVVLNCAAVPEALLEAELFGHTKGAFTGAVQARMGRIEAAQGGTLFLDEIGELPLALQAKLLRFLENGELQRIGSNETVCVDVRVVAATHQNLDERVAERAFRLDLLHRLAVFPIEIPALRDRLEDLPELVEHFLTSAQPNGADYMVTAEAMAKLRSHTWPGNVRELAHVLERAAILAEGRGQITSAELMLRRSIAGRLHIA